MTEQETYNKGYKQGYADRIEMEKTLRVEDCISRQEARNALLYKGQHNTRYKPGQTWELNLFEIEEVLNELPSVTPKQKIGHWIVDVDRWGDVVTTVNGYRCSECNAFNTDKDNYCPNCGARLESEE